MTHDYSWPLVRDILRDGPEPHRPALPAWDDVDRALVAAIRACPLALVVLLGAVDAPRMAEGIYVLNEGGPSTLDVVIAVGHADRTVGCHFTSGLEPRLRATIDALFGEAHGVLAGGDLGAALRAVAAAITQVRAEA